ncbi:MAG: hypothetical protein AAF570_11240 [Bacteroidota bacterium]
MESGYRQIFTATKTSELEPVTKLLGQNGIRFKVEQDNSSPTPLSAYFQPITLLILGVPERDLADAVALLEESGMIGKGSIEVELEDFFDQFTHQELIEILSEPHNWAPEQLEEVREILKERGIEVTAEEERRLQQNQLANAREPMRLGLGGQILLLIFSVVGAPVAVVFSFYVWQFMGTDPEGKKYPLYTQESRQVGMVSFFISLIATSVFIYLWSTGKFS